MSILTVEGFAFRWTGDCVTFIVAEGLTGIGNRAAQDV